MAHAILKLIFHIFVEVVAYWLGRMMVAMISPGHWKCDPIAATVPRGKLCIRGTYHRRNEKVYLTNDATEGIGVLTLIALISVGILIFVWPRG